MTDELQPALTADEWSAALAGGVKIGHLTGHLIRNNATDTQYVAAVCLYGKPFGFSQEDVEYLEGLLVVLDRYPRDGDFYKPRVASLAARIAALLPPAS